MARLSSLLYLLVLIIIVDSSRFISAKRILVVPYTNVSHTIVIEAVMRRLAERGHEITVLWANDYPLDLITKNPHYKLIAFSLNMRSEFEWVQEVVQREFLNDARRGADTDTSLLAGILGAYTQMEAARVRASRAIEFANKYCQKVLSDSLIMNILRERRFDLALVDDFFVARCTYLIPHVLGIKTVFNLVTLYGSVV